MLPAITDPVSFQGATHTMKPQLQLSLTWSITSVRNCTKPAHCYGGSFKAGSVNEKENSYTEEGLNVPTCFQVKVTQMGLGLEKS